MNNPTLVWSEKLTRKQSDRLIRWGKSIQLAERERIIKMLNENWIEPMDWLTVEALIKGEQK